MIKYIWRGCWSVTPDSCCARCCYRGCAKRGRCYHSLYD